MGGAALNHKIIISPSECTLPSLLMKQTDENADDTSQRHPPREDVMKVLETLATWTMHLTSMQGIVRRAGIASRAIRLTAIACS